MQPGKFGLSLERTDLHPHPRKRFKIYLLQVPAGVRRSHDTHMWWGCCGWGLWLWAAVVGGCCGYGLLWLRAVVMGCGWGLLWWRVLWLGAAVVMGFVVAGAEPNGSLTLPAVVSGCADSY